MTTAATYRHICRAECPCHVSSTDFTMDGFNLLETEQSLVLREPYIVRECHYRCDENQAPYMATTLSFLAGRKPG